MYKNIPSVDKNKNGMYISISLNDKIITAELSEETAIVSILSVIRGQLMSLGYSENIFDQAIIDLYHEIEE